MGNSPESNSTPAQGVSAPSLQISTLGLGCVTFGREIDRDASFAMLDHAASRGITMLDTAAAYGSGASEAIVGTWITERGARRRVTIATKILPPYSPSLIEVAIDSCLQRMGATSIDVLFLHRWDATVDDDATLRSLDRLVSSGRVRTLGASNFTAEQLERALARQAALGVAPFRALQNIHNLAVRGVDDALRRLCTQARIEIITYSPLGAGFLTGKHEEAVQRGSRFDIIPGHQNVYFNDLARQRLARLKAVAARSGVPMTKLALSWALHQPQIDTVLVGGRTPAHLEQAFEAKNFAPTDLLRELDAE